MGSRTLRPISVAHPGGTVVDYLDSHGWTQRDLSRRSGLTPKTVSEICNGKAPVSSSTSIAFERVFGRPAHFWMNLQSRFDEALARRAEAERSTEWKAWLRQFPLNEMRKRGWLPPKGAAGESEASALLGFLGVSSPASWNAVWKVSRVSYRQTRRFKTSDQAVSAWARATELAAEDLEVAEFDEARLRDAIPDLRHNTRLDIEDALPNAQQIGSQCGVAVVLVPALPRTGISGCARWLGDKRAIVALSLRYRVDDQIWFTFFHELGHVLLHRKQQPFILDNADESLTDGVVDPEMQRFEDEANRFAADTLIPPLALKDFMSANVFTNESIYDFAEAIGIAPGVVVGRLQREGLLKQHEGNRLKQGVKISVNANGDG